MELVTKSEFAKMCGVSGARVSQWLREGKISPDAMVGEGRSAKINATLAAPQVEERSDASQRYSMNGLNTKLGGSAQARVPLRTAEPDDSVEGQIKREKLKQTQLHSARMDREERQSQGFLTDTAAARAENYRSLADEHAHFEGVFRDLSSLIAAKFGISGREVLHIMQTGYRPLRAAIAAEHREKAKREPLVIETPVDMPPGDIQ